MGSRKYGNLVAFVFLLTAILELAALLSAPSIAKTLPGGPYAQIGALAVFFNSTSPDWVFGILTALLTRTVADRVHPQAATAVAELLRAQLLGQVEHLRRAARGTISSRFSPLSKPSDH